MTTIIIDERTKKGKIILDLVRELNAGEILPQNRKAKAGYNQTTLEAIKEAIEGRTVVCESFEDYLIKVAK